MIIIIYIVSYDLNKKRHNSEMLHKMLEAYPSQTHICNSTWLVSTPDNCVTVRDNLMRALKTNDYVFVAKLSGSYAGALTDKNWNWLEENAF